MPYAAVVRVIRGENVHDLPTNPRQGSHGIPLEQNGQSFRLQEANLGTRLGLHQNGPAVLVFRGFKDWEGWTERYRLLKPDRQGKLDGRVSLKNLVQRSIALNFEMLGSPRILSEPCPAI